MYLTPIIKALRERVPAFGNRVAGAADFKLLPENQAMQVPAGFVIPLDDTPEEPMSLNATRQTLRDGFAVVVALSNVADERGQGAALDAHAIRAAVWAALLGWEPAEDYDGIQYDGGHLLHLDRARLWYQLEFSAETSITPADGYQETEHAQLPAFKGADVDVDVIDPIAKPRPGPDGRVEFVMPIPKTGDLPT